jgi:hypothetical protein
MNDYTVGERIRVKGEFKIASVFTDPGPGNVTFKIKPPVGSIVQYVYPTDAEVVQESTGKYYVDVLLNVEGKWYLRCEGVGSVVGADEKFVRVENSPFV